MNPSKLKRLESNKHLKNNKSPGVDGITSEFYKLFSEVAPFLFEVFLESIKNNVLPPTMSQGLITLIPTNKEVLLIDNWCPICLHNNDYKILALLLSKIIKEVLDAIIDETVWLHEEQTYF